MTVLALIAVCIAHTAYGQPTNIPASLQTSPIPRLAPSQLPQLAPGATGLSPGTLTNTAPEQPVVVTDVVVEGVTVFPASEVDGLVKGLIGPAVPLKDIEDRRLALLRRYRNSGFPLVSVQATRGADGVLRFVVFEGRIADVKLDGDIGPAAVQVLRFLQHLTEYRPIDAASLERWLLLAQDVPGVSVEAVLQPSDAEPGALRMIAKVSRKAISGLLTADNRAFQLTGPEESLAIVDFNSFTSMGEKTELSLFHAFGGTELFGQASEEAFIGGSGLRLRLYAGAGDTTPSGFLRQQGYTGNTTVAGAQLTYPLIRAREQTLNLVAMFDMLDSNITTAPQVDGVSAGRTVAGKEAVRAIRFGSDYAIQDVLLGDTRQGVNGASFRISQGIPGLGATSDHSATPTRVGAVSDFFKFSGELSRNQTLFAPWSGASVSVLALAAGQLSNSVLPTTEEFFLGGSRFTRGYYQGEVSGDNAVALTGELQLTTGTALNLFGHEFDIASQFYLFYDYGEAWLNQATGPNRTLRSYGLGARMSFTDYLEVDLEGTHRLSLYPNGTNSAKLSEDVFYWCGLVRF